MSFHNVFVRQCKKNKIESKNKTKAHFILEVKAENDIYIYIYIFFLIYQLYGPNLAPKAYKNISINLGGQFATFEANVMTIKYCCFDEIHNIGSN